ncbi:MAG: SPOR domain-containing protein [Proteobacteria bacterium]|nr:SPOR domain-containing protein [Pseudomonadota bacterium]
MKLKKRDFDFKGFFFFIISLGSLMLLIFILIQEIKNLRQNMLTEEPKLEVQQKNNQENNNIAIQNAYTTIHEEKKQPTIQKEEKTTIIKVGTFKNKKNVDKIVSLLKKEKHEYKITGKGVYKIYVFAKSERERDKIISLLKSKNIKPVIVKELEN